MTSEISGRFKRWFWRPPRAHGEILADRQVSNLELFYDLLYVAVLGQAAHHLAGLVSIRGLASFAVVFALIWIAWINGTLYLELHGREDGRTRSIVFLQMGILVLLAVFTADAASGGWGFAVVYATYQVFQTGLWDSIWRQDRRDHPEFVPTTAGYVVGMGVSATVIGASALLLVGSRLPRANRVALANWVISHLPIALAITAAGAGMVSLIGHAHDATTPASTSWLLAGAVATGLLALVLTEQALADAERLSVVFHPLRLALCGGAATALIVGWLRPAPWLLALLLVAILSAVWFFAVSRFLRVDAWGEP
jgi:low temperature requirement protein LtrA